MRGIEAFQKRKIYVIGNALGITAKSGREDELHALVAGMTGKDSIRELSYREAAAVIGRLEELQENTGSPKPLVSGKKKEHPSRPGGVTGGQQRKIWALMYELKKHDAQPNTAQLGDRLCAVIKKELGVDAIAKAPFRWLTFKQGNNLIEILKGYVASLERKEAEKNGVGIKRPEGGAATDCGDHRD